MAPRQSSQQSAAGAPVQGLGENRIFAISPIVLPFITLIGDDTFAPAHHPRHVGTAAGPAPKSEPTPSPETV
jgi:hypothetical protein